MFATASIVGPWLELLIGLVLLGLAPVVFRYQPKFDEHVRNFWGIKPPSESFVDFQRTASSGFFIFVGAVALIGSFVRLI